MEKGFLFAYKNCHLCKKTTGYILLRNCHLLEFIKSYLIVLKIVFFDEGLKYDLSNYPSKKDLDDKWCQLKKGNDWITPIVLLLDTALYVTRSIFVTSHTAILRRLRPL